MCYHDQDGPLRADGVPRPPRTVAYGDIAKLGANGDCTGQHTRNTREDGVAERRMTRKPGDGEIRHGYVCIHEDRCIIA